MVEFFFKCKTNPAAPLLCLSVTETQIWFFKLSRIKHSATPPAMIPELEEAILLNFHTSQLLK